MENENCTVVAMSSSNEYVPYLSVCLQSLKEHSSIKNNYNIVIFEKSITNENKKILQEQIVAKNISLRFVNPENLINKYELQYPAQYSLECYFRLVAPLILEQYTKMIFTDVDLIFQKDIKELYEIDLGNKALGAVQDYIWNIFINTPELEWKEYCNSILQLDKPDKYFNTGVLILNIKEFNKNEYSKQLLELVSHTYFKILEQDGLNKYFQTNIKYLNSAWNFPVMNSVFKYYQSYMPEDIFKLYKQDQEHPYIIHFAGCEKPWFYPNMDFADIWWEYAKKTPFYEEIVKRYKEHKTKRKNEVKKELKLIKFKVQKYSILSFFTFGKKHKYYHDKLVNNKRYLEYLLQENN